MKKFLILASAMTAVVSAPALAAPGNTASALGSATATVIAPITLTHVSGTSLNFGTFTAGNGGTVVVARATGVATAGGDVTLVSGSTSSADSFDVTGQAARTFQITTAGGTVSNGTDTMSFVTDANATGTLDGSGLANFAVGGTLTVPDSAPAGTYSGTYSATVTYN